MCQAFPRITERITSATRPTTLKARPMPWVMPFASSSMTLSFSVLRMCHVKRSSHCKYNLGMEEKKVRCARYRACGSKSCAVHALNRRDLVRPAHIGELRHKTATELPDKRSQRFDALAQLNGREMTVLFRDHLSRRSFAS